MNRSVIIAVGIAGALALYFAVGTMLAADHTANNKNQSDAKPTPQDPVAIISVLNAEPHPVNMVFKGQTAPDKVVTVKSGTMGTVVSTPAQEGQFVRKGDLLCGLDVEARRANVQQAEAQRAAALIDYEAAEALARKGLTPANRQASAKAALDAATAAVSSAKVELSKTQIRAPFSGIFERRMAEAGDFLSPGGACGVLVDLSPVLVAAQITEEQAGLVRPGLDAIATLASGQEFPASIRYVARTADERTRTFSVEAALETADAFIGAGVTASLRVPLAERDAVLLSSALLTLSDDGSLGVRHVNDDDVVEFAKVQIIDNSDSGVWVVGLPNQVRVITAGQDFLSQGVRVQTVDIESEPS